MLIWRRPGYSSNYNATVWSAIKSGLPANIHMYFTDSRVDLQDQDISLDSGLTVTDIFNGDTDLVFGGTISRQVRVRILNSSRLESMKMSWTSEFELYFYLYNTNAYRITVGYFTGDKPKNVTTAQYIDFIAYDGMKKFDVPADDFVKRLTYPVTVGGLFSSLCAYVGVTAGSTTDALANALSRSYDSMPVDLTGYSCRDILSWIAEACGCYAVMNGHDCDLVWFKDNTSHTISQTEEFGIETGDLNSGLTWDQFDALSNVQQEGMTYNDIAGYREAYKVNQVTIKQIDSDFDINYPIDYGDNVYTIVCNPFLSVSTEADVTNYVKPIYDRLNNFGGYIPIQLMCVGDPSVQAGDIVTINVNGTNYSIPIFMKTMKWNGTFTDTIETTGQIPRASYRSEYGKERALSIKELRMYVYDNYYDRKSGITITDEGILMDASRYIDILSGGSIEVESGGDINVKSGGNLNVASGGNIDINATGNLKLSGSTVEIKSGSTFDVDSQNFKISSQSGYFETSGWKLNADGLLGYIHYDATRNGAIAIGGPGIFNIPQNTRLLAITGSYMVHNNDLVGNFYFDIAYPDTSMEQLIVGVGNGVTIDSRTRDGNGNYSENGGTIGGVSSRWDIWADDIVYRTITQNSSRDIKHDICQMESVGERLDQLRPVTFVYDDDENEKTRMGLIYEDTIEVMPEICTGDENNKAISYVELIPALLKEIQELRNRVAELERGN